MDRTILVVDDEPKIVRLVQRYLENAGYRVITADNGDSAIQRYYGDRPDLVVLDLMIPGVSGLDVARVIRGHGNTPIIMVTALSEETDRLAGLDIGADDYVTKPFSPRELVARVRAVLRRSATTGTDDTARVPAAVTNSARAHAAVTVGPITIDPVKRVITRDGIMIPLTTYQFDLLLILAGQPGRVFSRMQLVEAIQGETYQGYERTVDAHMKNIRRMLGDSARKPRFIETIRGVGYRFIEQTVSDQSVNEQTAGNHLPADNR